MRIPTIRGIIDRRILANFRVDPDAIRRVLPPPFRPKLIRGQAIAGICLIRLKQVRPAFLPPLPVLGRDWGRGLRLGLASENAAHRIAVECDEDGQTRAGDGRRGRTIISLFCPLFLCDSFPLLSRQLLPLL